MLFRSQGRLRRGTAIQGDVPRTVQSIDAPGRSAALKVHIGLRLDPEIVAAVKAFREGYNSRVEKVLREAIAAGAFARPETR